MAIGLWPPYRLPAGAPEISSVPWTLEQKNTTFNELREGAIASEHLSRVAPASATLSLPEHCTARPSASGWHVRASVVKPIVTNKVPSERPYQGMRSLRPTLLGANRPNRSTPTARLGRRPIEARERGPCARHQQRDKRRRKREDGSKTSEEELLVPREHPPQFCEKALACAQALH